MNIYGALRIVHSYWRWIVVLFSLVAIARGFAGSLRRRAWTAGDERASRLFVAAIDIQVSLGLLLYFAFSPFWPVVRDSFQYAIRDRTSRFFGMEHETAMVLAFLVVHVGRIRIVRATGGVAKHRALLASVLVFFAMSLWAIPWPWRSVARPLFRTSL